MERETLQAPEGMMYTDGADYGTKIDLEVGRSKDDFSLITLEEYSSMTESEEATAEDYINALERLGVK